MLLCEIVVGQMYNVRPRGCHLPIVAKFVKQNPACSWWWVPIDDDVLVEFFGPVLVVGVGALVSSPVGELLTPSWAICLCGERLMAIDPYYLSPASHV